MPRIPAQEVRATLQTLCYNAKILKAWKDTLAKDAKRPGEELGFLQAAFDRTIQAAHNLAKHLPPPPPPSAGPPPEPPPQPQPAPVSPPPSSPYIALVNARRANPWPDGLEIAKAEAVVTSIEHDGSPNVAIVLQIPSDITPVIIQAPRH